MARQLLIWLIVTTLSVAVSADCPANCQCTDSEMRCADAQLNNVPQYMGTNLQSLNLKNNSLRDVSRDDLGMYSMIHVLDLSANKLERIDDGAFESCSSLMKLNLGGNQLQSLFAGTFAGLEDNLVYLNLTGNGLTRVFPALEFKRLRELYLGYNHLTQISEDSLIRVPNLRILDLRNNSINLIHPKAFANLGHLRFLILRNNPLGQAASKLDLRPNAWLHILDLTNCRIKKELSALPKRVRDVRLSNNNLTNVTSMFKEARYIDMIILNDNGIVYIDPEALSALPYLREVWLNRNRLERIPQLPEYIRSIHIDDNVINALDSNSFKVTPYVEIISLQNNKITRLPSESFRNLRLRMIDISMNEIAVLQRYTFSNLPVLYSVDLSRNPIQRLDVRSFDNVTNLHWLQMARTKVDMVEVENLEMLHMMKKLQYLDLSSSPGVANKLISSGVGLEEVRTLNLMFNDLKTLPANFPEKIPNIRLLYLSGNHWHCNSTLSWLPDYILENDNLFFAKAHIVCYTPLKWRGRAIHTLTIDEMKEVVGPPIIDVEPCPDCKEPCDTAGPEIVEGDGGVGVEEGGTAEPAELRQADNGHVRKVVKFRGKILTTTVVPATEVESAAEERITTDETSQPEVTEPEEEIDNEPAVEPTGGPALSANNTAPRLQPMALRAEGHEKAPESSTDVEDEESETKVEEAVIVPERVTLIGINSTNEEPVTGVQEEVIVPERVGLTGSENSPQEEEMIIPERVGLTETGNPPKEEMIIPERVGLTGSENSPKEEEVIAPERVGLTETGNPPREEEEVIVPERVGLTETGNSPKEEMIIPERVGLTESENSPQEEEVIVPERVGLTETGNPPQEEEEVIVPERVGLTETGNPSKEEMIIPERVGLTESENSPREEDVIVPERVALTENMESKPMNESPSEHHPESVEAENPTTEPHGEEQVEEQKQRDDEIWDMMARMFRF